MLHLFTVLVRIEGNASPVLEQVISETAIDAETTVELAHPEAALTTHFEAVYSMPITEGMILS